MVIDKSSYILNDAEKRSHVYRMMKDLTRKNRRLAGLMAADIISLCRRRMLCELFARNGYSQSQVWPVRFLRKLCSKPDAIDWRSTNDCPPGLEPVWDHAVCFNRFGKPAFLVVHPYNRITGNQLEKVQKWCKQTGSNFGSMLTASIFLPSL